MIANLPLLFVNGIPTALSKITAAELERFITFMVTCSWGHDTARDIRQPPWWPTDVPFSHPFVRICPTPKDWEARLKKLVRCCYDFHKSAFLLVFSAQLARYPPNRLRYVDNHDHTTSLYYRPNNRLLVTFRNENLFYDKNSPIEIDDEPLEIKPTDIYLCDNCDSHFDNFEILKVHERLCNNDNLPSSTISGGLPEFLSALKLQPVGEVKLELKPQSAADSEHRPRNSRTTTNIDRGPPYPFSSLAYIRNSKCHIQRDTTYSRERVERYCSTSAPISKFFSYNKGKNMPFPVRYRRPIDYWNRKYVFPGQRNKKALDLKAQLYLLKCRPISVDLERMTIKSIQEYIDKMREEAERRAEYEDRDVVFVDSSDCDLQDCREVKDPLKKAEGDCEVIDLCSDDEGGGEKGLPLAGVACVVRGGAVLRRTGCTAPAAPAPDEPSGARQRPLPPTEPCNARQRPLPPAVLQPHALQPLPHPVILITQTLNTLQTISLE